VAEPEALAGGWLHGLEKGPETNPRAKVLQALIGLVERDQDGMIDEKPRLFSLCPGPFLRLAHGEANINRGTFRTNFAEVVLVAILVEYQRVVMPWVALIGQAHGQDIDLLVPVPDREKVRGSHPGANRVGAGRQCLVADCEVERNGCLRLIALRGSGTGGGEGGYDEKCDCGYVFHDDLLFGRDIGSQSAPYPVKREEAGKGDIRDGKSVPATVWTILSPPHTEVSMAEKPLEEGTSPGLAPLAPEIAAEMGSSLYGELHRLAAAKMRFERGNHTLQPTALVHEAYLRLADRSEPLGKDRIQVLGLAAHIMRNILVDHARTHQAAKRGAGAVQVTLDEGLVAAPGSMVDVLAVDDALTRLAEFDRRQADILELHFFAGLTFEEIALQLGLSARTVKRDWSMARAWLRQELGSSR